MTPDDVPTISFPAESPLGESRRAGSAVASETADSQPCAAVFCDTFGLFGVFAQEEIVFEIGAVGIEIHNVAVDVIEPQACDLPSDFEPMPPAVEPGPTVEAIQDEAPPRSETPPRPHCEVESFAAASAIRPAEDEHGPELGRAFAEIPRAAGPRRSSTASFFHVCVAASTGRRLDDAVPLFLVGAALGRDAGRRGSARGRATCLAGRRGRHCVGPWRPNAVTSSQ